MTNDDGVEMLTMDIPGMGFTQLENLVLDMNGTVACDGMLLDGVAETLSVLGEQMRVFLITADTHGGASEVAHQIGATLEVIAPGNEGAQKAALVRELGAASVAAVGNGANDVEMLRDAAVGVCVIGREGVSGAALGVADVVTTSIADALELFANPARLVATLRR